MTEIKINHQIVEAAVLGGAVLGGGGGGSMDRGRELGLLATQIGEPRLLDIGSFADDAQLVTVSAVGAPAAKEAVVKPIAYMRAVELLLENSQGRPKGLITNECGGNAVVNGWLQSAMLGIPVVDAPCNGRAHPTGAMGSMGLHAVADYTSLQAAAGGDVLSGSYLEVFFSGKLEQGANLIRQAAIQAGGLVAVARNPISAAYVRKNGAPGAVRQSIELGKAMLAAQKEGGQSVIAAAADYLKGDVVGNGFVEKVELETAGGFDVGRVLVAGYELTFWNEYMTLEKGGLRLATFPDLIMTLDWKSGLPVTSAEIREGQEIAILRVEAQHLILGAGMLAVDLYCPAERVTGKELIKYL